MTDESERDWSDHESGPFCRHWSGAGDCDLVCVTCDHGCTWHHVGEDDTHCTLCDCAAWKEPAEP